MVLSNNETDEAIGGIRLGIAAVLTPLWLLGGAALIWFENYVIGVAAVGVGLILMAGCIRLYRAFQRPDVVQDERIRQLHDRSGSNAFWAVVVLPLIYFGFSVFLPPTVTEWVIDVVGTGTGIVWGASLIVGFAVYLCSIAYYRTISL